MGGSQKREGGSDTSGLDHGDGQLGTIPQTSTRLLDLQRNYPQQSFSYLA
jgi:hypothetical protein